VFVRFFVHSNVVTYSYLLISIDLFKNMFYGVYYILYLGIDYYYINQIINYINTCSSIFEDLLLKTLSGIVFL